MGIDRQEPLRNLGVIVARIRGTADTGRLAVRNSVRLGVLHLYFERGRLVHLEGSRGNVDDALIDLAGWTEGQIRFDKGVLPERQVVTPEQEDFFHRTLLLLQQHGVVAAFPRLDAQPPAHPPRPIPPLKSARPLPQTPPSRAYSRPLPALPPLPLVQAAQAEVLLTNHQWALLVEAAHAMLESAGRLFGQHQAQNILRHVLAEQGEQSEILGLLQVDRQGWLRELRLHEMLAQPVQEVAAAFVLLISDFERRCAALVGEEKARQIIGRALLPYQSALTEIGIALHS